MLENKGGNVPAVDTTKNLNTYKAFSDAIQKGLVASAIGVGRGGLGATFSVTIGVPGNAGQTTTHTDAGWHLQ